MKKIELMAPSGKKEALIGAINAGANAVYLGIEKFGARAFAGNFEKESLIEVVAYAHLRNVKVYVTLNTLLFDDEVEAFLEVVDFLLNADVDAFIMQDLGMIDLVHHRYPLATIHASTQVNAHHLHQVQFLKELGVSRVIMARETSIDTIQEIKAAIDIEIEVFVHGALCVSYSGNCLFSSMVSQRSGNRGECAQSCRLPYTLLKDGVKVSEEAYLMSTKDLLAIEHLSRLIEAGVDAIKIEGRMRKPEYVVQTVLSYKHAIEAYYDNLAWDSQQEIERLKRVFNREYTEGFLLNAKPYTINNAHRPNHMGIEVGKVLHFQNGKVTVLLSDTLSVGDGIRMIGEKDSGDVVSRIMKDSTTVSTAYAGDKIVLDSRNPISPGDVVHKTLDQHLENELGIYLNPYYSLIPLQGKVEVLVGKPILLEIVDSKGSTFVFSSDTLVERAIQAPLSEAQILKQFAKLGNTPFFFSQFSIHTDGDSFIPVKELNELRRKAIETITFHFTSKRNTYCKVQEPIIPGSFHPDSFELIAKIRTEAQLSACIDSGIKTIYYEDTLIVDESNYPGIHFACVQKRICDPKSDCVVPVHSLVNEIGTIYANPDKNLGGDQFLNVTNIYTANLLSRKGLNRITLSLELHKDQVLGFQRLYQDRFGIQPHLEMIVYGYTELMLSKYCPIAKTTGVNQTHCHLCERNQYALQDRMGYSFPLLNDGECNIRVLNAKPLNLVDTLSALAASGITKARMDFTVEPKEETMAVIQMFQRKLRNESYELDRHHVTYGRFFK